MVGIRMERDISWVYDGISWGTGWTLLGRTHHPSEIGSVPSQIGLRYREGRVQNRNIRKEWVFIQK